MKMNLLWCCFITVIICVECGPISEYTKENRIYNNDGAGSTDDVRESFQIFGLKEIDTNTESFEKISSYVKTNNDEEKNYYTAKGITPDYAVRIIPITLKDVNTKNSIDAENYGTDEERKLFFQFKQKHSKEHEDSIVDSNNNDNNGTDSSKSFVQTAITHTDNENTLAEEVSNSTLQTVANTQVIEILDEGSGSSGSGSGGDVDLGSYDNDVEIFLDDADVYIITKTFSKTTTKYFEFPDDSNNTTHISDDYLTQDVLIDDSGFGSGDSSGELDDVDDNLNKNKETALHKLIPEEELIIEGSGTGSGSGAGSGDGKISYHGNGETFIDDEDLYAKMKRVSTTSVNFSPSTIYDHTISGSGENPYLGNVDENSGSGSGSEESSGDGDVDKKERIYFPTNNRMISSMKSVESVRSTTSNGNADFYYLNYDEYQDFYLY